MGEAVEYKHVFIAKTCSYALLSGRKHIIDMPTHKCTLQLNKYCVICIPIKFLLRDISIFFNDMRGRLFFVISFYKQTVSVFPVNADSIFAEILGTVAMSGNLQRETAP